MRRRLRGFPLRRFGLALLAAAMATAAGADDNSVMSTTGLGKVGGAEVYGHICQGCHMPDAQGAAGAGHYPKLAGDPALVSWQYVALTVLHGKNGMPAFGQQPTGEIMDFALVHLSDAQVADVVNYVRSNFGNHYKDRITAEQVAALPHPGTASPAAKSSPP
jgi:mono/diheme cytochrome c family protein